MSITKTVINDVSDMRVGRITNLDPCGLYKHSPLAEARDFALNEPELPIDLSELIANHTLGEIEAGIELYSGLLSKYLAERNRRVGWSV